MYKYIRGIALCTLIVFCLSSVTVLNISAHTLTRSSDAETAYQRDVNRKNSERNTDLYTAVISGAIALGSGCIACVNSVAPEPTGATKVVAYTGWGICVAGIAQACVSLDSYNNVPCEGACGTLMESNEAGSLHVSTCSNPGHPMINPHQWWTCSPYGTGSTECPHSSEHVHECPGPCAETFSTAEAARITHLVDCYEAPCNGANYYDCLGQDCPNSDNHYELSCRGGCGTLFPSLGAFSTVPDDYEHYQMCQERVHRHGSTLWLSTTCSHYYYKCNPANTCPNASNHYNSN